jgi:hypothetical protein
MRRTRGQGSNAGSAAGDGKAILSGHEACGGVATRGRRTVLGHTTARERISSTARATLAPDEGNAQSMRSPQNLQLPMPGTYRCWRRWQR